MIILDFGSGNSCGNDWSIAKRMIDALAKIDKERQCVIKWQLFKEAPPNIPLLRSIFTRAYEYGKELGFKTTASVFDLSSLNFLITFDIPFAKFSNRRDLDWLIGEVPRKIDIVWSVHDKTCFDYPEKGIDEFLCCVSKYPAMTEEYESIFGEFLKYGISDHTTDWTLYWKYQPKIYEVHFRLEDTIGLDSGPFARTPEQLKEIL